MADITTYKKTSHGSLDTGAQRTWTPTAMANDSTDTGLCRNCHVTHASVNGAAEPNAGDGYINMLFNLDDLTVNGVCYDCHTNYNSNISSWPGRDTYNLSGHGSTANGVVWPGANPAARAAGEKGWCINCHNPHGRRVFDADNKTGGPYTTVAADPVRDMLIRQEENLCLNCHKAAGPAGAADIQSTLTLSPNNASPTFYSHPVDEGLVNSTLSYHLAGEDGLALNSTTRHAECEDCHNPHIAKNDGTAGSSVHKIDTNLISPALLGSWGVSVKNSVAWTAPTFTKTQLTSTTGNYEYELCFRCHSSYSSGWPASNTDQSIEFDTLNLSYHPVEDKGRKGGTGASTRATFVGPWSQSSVMYCSDCHGPNSALAGADTGPHGSANAGIIRGPYTALTGSSGNITGHLCFFCHDADVYSNSATTSAATASSFNDGGVNLHWFHLASVVNDDNGLVITCQRCHLATPHGINRRHLIAFSTDAAPYNGGAAKPTAYTPSNNAYGEPSCTVTTVGGKCYGGH